MTTWPSLGRLPFMLMLVGAMAHYSYVRALRALPLLLTGVLSHMQMQEPSPLRDPHSDRAAEPKDYNILTPLHSDGSDFPCKGYQWNTLLTSVATYNAGQTYQMRLMGGATHGGGSCQISLSCDMGKHFKVLKSMEGGCPLEDTYNFTIPSDAETAQCFLAWTWFNKVGNREMYMNCAVVDIFGSSSSSSSSTTAQAALGSLPDMYVANLKGINDCITKETIDTIFDDPGLDVIYADGVTTASRIMRRSNGPCTGVGRRLTKGSLPSSSSGALTSVSSFQGDNGQWHGDNSAQGSSPTANAASIGEKLPSCYDERSHPDCYGMPVANSLVYGVVGPNSISQSNSKSGTEVQNELDNYLKSLAGQETTSKVFQNTADIPQSKAIPVVQTEDVPLVTSQAESKPGMFYELEQNNGNDSSQNRSTNGGYDYDDNYSDYDRSSDTLFQVLSTTRESPKSDKPTAVPDPDIPGDNLDATASPTGQMNVIGLDAKVPFNAEAGFTDTPDGFERMVKHPSAYMKGNKKMQKKKHKEVVYMDSSPSTGQPYLNTTVASMATKKAITDMNTNSSHQASTAFEISSSPTVNTIPASQSITYLPTSYATGNPNDYLPCKPGTFLCKSQEQFYVCGQFGGNEWTYGGLRDVSSGMICQNGDIVLEKGHIKRTVVKKISPRELQVESLEKRQIFGGDDYRPLNALFHSNYESDGGDGIADTEGKPVSNTLAVSNGSPQSNYISSDADETKGSTKPSLDGSIEDIAAASSKLTKGAGEGTEGNAEELFGQRTNLLERRLQKRQDEPIQVPGFVYSDGSDGGNGIDGATDTVLEWFGQPKDPLYEGLENPSAENISEEPEMQSVEEDVRLGMFDGAEDEEPGPEDVFSGVSDTVTQNTTKSRKRQEQDLKTPDFKFSDGSNGGDGIAEDPVTIFGEEPENYEDEWPVADGDGIETASVGAVSTGGSPTFGNQSNAKYISIPEESGYDEAPQSTKQEVDTQRRQVNRLDDKLYTSLSISKAIPAIPGPTFLTVKGELSGAEAVAMGTKSGLNGFAGVYTSKFPEDTEPKVKPASGFLKGYVPLPTNLNGLFVESQANPGPAATEGLIGKDAFNAGMNVPGNPSSAYSAIGNDNPLALGPESRPLTGPVDAGEGTEDAPELLFPSLVGNMVLKNGINLTTDNSEAESFDNDLVEGNGSDFETDANDELGKVEDDYEDDSGIEGSPPTFVSSTPYATPITPTTLISVKFLSVELITASLFTPSLTASESFSTPIPPLNTTVSSLVKTNLKEGHNDIESSVWKDGNLDFDYLPPTPTSNNVAASILPFFMGPGPVVPTNLNISWPGPLNLHNSPTWSKVALPSSPISILGSTIMMNAGVTTTVSLFGPTPSWPPAIPGVVNGAWPPALPGVSPHTKAFSSGL